MRLSVVVGDGTIADVLVDRLHDPEGPAGA
jgi:hypothetical protein